ncbi:hypothetical protein ACFOY4_01300 [Actinomadura syzygii]|uniref:hypothetical protein n=1 Tax=Actinomadura syzygii TaxID=1427538 RepID=UPI00165272E4|nr:hypothetical protein [Actinomadura syzygii]
MIKPQSVVARADVERLALTPRHRMLYSVPVASAAPVIEVIDDETVAVEDLKAGVEQLDALEQRWGQFDRAGVAAFTVADTNVFLHRADRLETLDSRVQKPSLSITDW